MSIIQTRAKRISRYGIAGAILLTGFSAMAAIPLENPGFENPEDFGPHWTVRGDGYETGIDASVSAEGNQSLRISGGPQARGVQFLQSIGAEQLRETSWNLTAAIQTEEIAISATAFVTVKSEAGDTLFQYDMRDRVVNGTTPFGHHTILIPQMENAATLTFGGLVIGSGTAWFDDFSLTAAIDPNQPTAEVAQQYLDDALKIIRSRAIRAEEANWSDITEAANKAIQGAQTTEQTYPAIRLALSMLPEPEHMGLRGPRPSSSEVVDKTPPPLKTPTVTVENGIGHLTIPAISNATTDEQKQHYLAQAAMHISAATEQVTCGWIIDLRNNTGGTMWPMLAAVSPFLTDGIVGYMITGSDENAAWVIKGNSAWIHPPDKEPVMRAQLPLQNPSQPLKITGPHHGLIERPNRQRRRNDRDCPNGRTKSQIPRHPNSRPNHRQRRHSPIRWRHPETKCSQGCYSEWRCDSWCVGS